jgi:hypothetical protein
MKERLESASLSKASLSTHAISAFLVDFVVVYEERDAKFASRE